ALLIERDDKLNIAAVAAKDEGILCKNRRAAVAVDRSVTNIVVLPDDFPVEIEAGRPLVAEVDEEPFAVGERRGAGVAVFIVRLWGGSRLAEDFRLPQRLAVLGIETNRLKRKLVWLAAGRGNGRSEIDLSLLHNWRRPAMPRNRLLPRDILGR